MKQWLTVLGATGSIGCSTLDVICLHPEKFGVFALSAANNVDRLVEQIIEFEPRYAVMVEAPAAQELQQQLPVGHPTEVLSGSSALEMISAHRSEEHTSELQSRPHLVCR